MTIITVLRRQKSQSKSNVKQSTAFRNLTVLSILSLSFIISGCQSVESKRAIAPSKVEVPVLNSAQRYSIFVSNFQNESDYQRGVFSSSEDRMGSQAKAILKSHVQMTKGFSLMDRDNLSAIAQESAIAGKKQFLKGAQLALSGAVTEFGRKTTGDRQFFGVLGSGKSQIAYAKVALNIIDVTTSEILFSVQGAGEYELSSREIVGFGSRAGYDATLNGKVLNLAITEAVSRLIEGLNQSQF